MDNFEKVEKLVAKANVSYEDAKKALDEANGDILDAMIILEKQGKVKQPEQQVFSTSPEQQSVYKDVPAAIEKSTKEDAKGFFKTVGDAIKRGFQYTVDNSLKIERKGETVFNIPLWLTIILLLGAWHLLLIIMLVSLFCGCRYSIVGKDDSREVNEILGQATDYAEKARNSFTADNTADNVNASESVVAEGTVEGTAEGSVEDNNDTK